MLVYISALAGNPPYILFKGYDGRRGGEQEFASLTELTDFLLLQLPKSPTRPTLICNRDGAAVTIPPHTTILASSNGFPSLNITQQALTTKAHSCSKLSFAPHGFPPMPIKPGQTIYLDSMLDLKTQIRRLSVPNPRKEPVDDSDSSPADIPTVES